MHDGPSTITAVLGPTNTGKTHRAVERMLEHDTGMIGLPLRLLAREVYDRVTRVTGEAAAALVTGEEKRIGQRARYWICTVEAMPIDRTVDFLAVDEIQLAAHAERGHVFTDRLLNARGRRETWFLGADTMLPLVTELVPTIGVKSHPRFSELRWAGRSSLAGLPARSAVVAFSMTRVYELAERIRARRGGAAVVLGALSPRARNAQVALYQSGEVDYMVATDAIGMGLNMDVDHVAFTDWHKFDGRRSRALEAAELAQIAGRAGRHLSNGTFGCVAPLPTLPLNTVRAIETHHFPRVPKLVWRNPYPDTSSLDALVASLKERPPERCLTLVERAEDFRTLVELAARPEIRQRASSPASVELLWDVCQIPDYRQMMLRHHEGLVAEIFLQLTGPDSRIDTDWLARRVRRVDDAEGDIDTLLMRMAFVRTWTYVSSHAHWVSDPQHWQERTRDIEDRLSDALHDQLVTRFVDTSKKKRRKPRNASAGSERTEAPIPDSPFAQLMDLRRTMSEPEDQPVSDWVDELVEAPHERFRVDASGKIYDGEIVLGALTRGSDLLRPEVSVTLSAELGSGARSRIQRRLVAFSRDLVEELLAPLRRDLPDELSAAGRGLVYQLEQSLGTVPTREARDQLAQLSADDRRRLGSVGVRLGRRMVYVRGLLKPARVQQRAALCSAYFAPKAAAPPPPGAVSFDLTPGDSRQSATALGFPAVGPRGVRADVVERVSVRLDKAARRGAFDAPKDLPSVLGCRSDQLPELLTALGYRAVDGNRYKKKQRPRRDRGR